MGNGKELSIKCPDCGYVPKPNEMSTNSWNVFAPSCHKCGTKFKLVVVMKNPEELSRAGIESPREAGKMRDFADHLSDLL